MIDGITPVHLIIVLVIALVIFGPGKLPGLGKALGESIREFRSSVSDLKTGLQVDVTPAPAPAAAPTPTVEPRPALQTTATAAQPPAAAPPAATAADASDRA
jgi:sec-independent protein translocase protein TatA